MASKLDPSLVIEFFFNGLQQRIKTPILMNEYTSYEDVLKKALRVDSNTDYMSRPVDP